MVNPPRVCVQSVSVKKYFEREVNRLTDYLKRQDLWSSQKREAEDHRKELVSFTVWFQTGLCQLKPSQTVAKTQRPTHIHHTPPMIREEEDKLFNIYFTRIKEQIWKESFTN